MNKNPYNINFSISEATVTSRFWKLQYRFHLIVLLTRCNLLISFYSFFNSTLVQTATLATVKVTVHANTIKLHLMCGNPGVL